MLKNYDAGKLYIKKRTLPEWLTLYIFLFPFLFSFALDFLNLPSVFKYTVDVVWIAVLLIVFARKNIVLQKKVVPFAVFAGAFLLFLFIVYLFNFQSPFYFLWGARNNFRVYAAFLAYITFFNEEDANSCLKFIDILFWINIAVTLYQFFILGYNQDYLGGIFGTEKGCNAYSIIFFALVITKSLLLYMNGLGKSLPCFLKCGFSLIIAAMAELKVFFIFFVIILVLAAIFTKFSWRKLLVFFITAVLIMLASSVLIAIFGDKQELTLQRIFELSTTSNYATTEDLGRFTAIPGISKNFLTDFPSRLFGMGLGNCDTSSFEICNTPFFRLHENLHYTWFLSAFLFLETGYIGLVIYLSFFVICFIFAFKHYRRDGGNRTFGAISMIMSILCIILTFYNSSLRMEVGYLAYFALALPIISEQTSDRQ